MLQAEAGLYGQTDQEFGSVALAEVIVGFVESDQRIVEFAKGTLRGLVDALTPKVNDLGAGRVVDGKALLLQHEVVGQIRDEEAKTLVQHAGPFPSRTTDDVCGCADAVDGLRFRVIETRGVVTIGKTASRKEFVPVERLQRHGEGSGKTANAMLHGAIGIQQLRTAGGDMRIRIHKIDQRSKGVPGQNRVAVEQAGVASPRHPHSKIIVSNIELVGRIADKDDLGEGFSDHVGAAIGRMIVDADDFKTHATGLFVNGGNALPQELEGIVAGDDHGEIELSFHPLLLLLFCLRISFGSWSISFDAFSVKA